MDEGEEAAVADGGGGAWALVVGAEGVLAAGVGVAAVGDDSGVVLVAVGVADDGRVVVAVVVEFGVDAGYDSAAAAVAAALYDGGGVGCDDGGDR